MARSEKRKKEALPDWSEVMMIADHAIEALRTEDLEDREKKWGQVFDEKLHGTLDILQVEFMPRDLSKERGYLVGTDSKGVKNLASHEVWKALLYKEKQHDKHLQAFDCLLQRVNEYAPNLYEDWVQGFNLGRLHQDIQSSEENGIPQVIHDAIIIEDGEFTFFTLLWIFRYAHKENYNLEAWLKPESIGEEKLPLHFKPPISEEKVDTQKEWWSAITAEEFILSLGLVKLDGKTPSERWTSFIKWLKRQRQYLHATAALQPSDQATPSSTAHITTVQKYKHFLHVLPIKNVHPLHDSNHPTAANSEFWEQAGGWVNTLLEFFLTSESEKLVEKLEHNVLDGLYSMACPEQETKLFKLLCDAEGLLDRNKKLGNHDELLTRLARPGYLPLEFILRQWVNKPMQLLILPLDFVTEKSGQSVDDQSNKVPTSLTFATIKGDLVEGIPAAFRWPEGKKHLTENDPEFKHDLSRAAKWLQPYYTLLNRLNHDFTTEQIWQQKQEATALASEDQFGHEIWYVLSSLRSNWRVKIEDFFTFPEKEQSSMSLGQIFKPSDEWYLQYAESAELSDIHVNDYLTLKEVNEPDPRCLKTIGNYLKQNTSENWTKVHELLLKDYINNFRLIPDNSIYSYGLDFLTAWSNTKSLSNVIPGKPSTLEGLIQSVWELAYRTMLTSIFRHQSFKLKDLLLRKREANALFKLQPDVTFKGNLGLLTSDGLIDLNPDNKELFRQSSALAHLFLTLFREHLQHSEYLTSPIIEVTGKPNNNIQLTQISERQKKHSIDSKLRFVEVLERIKRECEKKDLSTKYINPDRLYTLYVDGISGYQQALNRHQKGLGRKVIEKILQRLANGQLLYRAPSKDETHYINVITFVIKINTSKTLKA